MPTARFGATGPSTASIAFCIAFMPRSSAGDDSTSASTGRDHAAVGASAPATKRAATSPPMLCPSSTSGPACSARDRVDHARQIDEQVIGPVQRPRAPPLGHGRAGRRRRRASRARREARRRAHSGRCARRGRGRRQSSHRAKATRPFAAAQRQPVMGFERSVFHFNLRRHERTASEFFELSHDERRRAHETQSPRAHEHDDARLLPRGARRRAPPRRRRGDTRPGDLVDRQALLRRHGARRLRRRSARRCARTRRASGSRSRSR